MAAYLVLARKYRSTTFDEVVGQEHVANTLKNAIKSGRVAHAFLFVGTRGVGKTTLARILAKALNCQASDGPTAEPCNKCESCISIARGDDVDVVEIDGASNRGIDEIRALRSNAIYRPVRGRYKIYYIDEVHMLTKEAFNALLKTLEEPPEHVKFIFATTEAEKLPATIVSRCQRFDFRDIPARQIAEHLRAICAAEKVDAEDGAIFRVARSAAGSMRDGLSLLDQLMAAGSGRLTEADVIAVLGTPADERTAEIVQSMAGNDAAATLVKLDGLLASGVTLESAVEAIGDFFRHMMLAKAAGAGCELIELPESQRKVVAELAGRYSLPNLVQAVVLLQNTTRNLRGLVSGRGLVEATLVRLAAADKFVDAASLLQRLERLSGGGTGRVAPTGGGMSAGPTGPARPAPGAQPASRFGSPGEPEQKKKVLTRAESSPTPTSPAAVNEAATPAGGPNVAAAPPSPAVTVPFELEYLKGHWPELVAAMNADRQGALAGLLAPATVMNIEGPLLRLGYDLSHEAAMEMAQRSGEKIASALSRIFDRPIRCEFASTGRAGSPPPAARANAASATLSSNQRAEIAQDPDVRTVMEFFGGTLSDIKHEGAPAPVDPAAEER